jgi:hypothetical protein
MAPWIFFLFVGVLDFGFYAYALISTQNAARAAVLHTSLSKAAASDPDGSGCQIVISEMLWAPNVRSAVTNCASSPLQATFSQIAGPDGNDAAKVIVTYTTVPMIPIPGVFTNQLTINRTVQAKVNPAADF